MPTIDTRDARRIGLIADTHDEKVDWASVQPKIAEAFGDVGLILHGGDAQTEAALDALETIAPVLSVQSEQEPRLAAPRVARDARVVETAGRRIGLVRKLPDDDVAKGAAIADELFGGPVDVVVFASTHVPVTAVVGGVLYVNPGSPTLAAQPMVAVLDVDGPVVSVEMIPINR